MNSQNFDEYTQFKTIKPRVKNSFDNDSNQSSPFQSIRYSPKRSQISRIFPARASISPLPENETEQMFTVYDSQESSTESNINAITSKYISKKSDEEQQQSPSNLFSGSPIRLLPENKSYNLDNLPSDAFAQPIEREEEIVPIILDLPLPQRIARKDTESDTEFIPSSLTKEDFINYIGQDIAKSLNSRLFKQRIKGLNEIQEILKSEQDLDNIAEIFFLGLSILPGFKESNLIVNQMMIDIIRHIITKAENISKSTVFMILPYLIEKSSDAKLKKSIYDLDMMISEALCPSFMILQLLEISSSKRNQKMIASSLDVSMKILETFGPGDLDVNAYIPLLTNALSSSNSEVKKNALSVSRYLYKKFGDAIYNINEKLPPALKSQFLNELSNVQEIHAPKRSYFRQRAQSYKPTTNTVKEEEKQPMKISDIITSEQCQKIMTSTKFAEHKNFLQSLESAIEACHFKIQSFDLEPILKSLKFLVTNGNQNIVALSLSVMRKLAESSDNGISKFTNYVAEAVIETWGDQRQSLRETATETAVIYKNTPVFIKLISNVQNFPSGMRLEILKYVERMSNDINSQDYSKITPIIFSSIDDKSPNVRTKALNAAMIVKSSCPEVFQQNFEKSSSQIQKKLLQLSADNSPVKKTAEKSESIKQEPIKQVVSPKSEKSDHETEQSEKINIVSTKEKKEKRLQQFQDLLNQQNLPEKAKITKISEQTKSDSQLIFPQSIFKGLFSNILAEQIVAIGNITALMKTEREPLEFLSDIFIKYLAMKINERQVKLVQLILQLLNDLLNTSDLSELELRYLISILILNYDKLGEVTDEIDDILFKFRVNIKQKLLSEIYIQLLNNKTISEASITVILSELCFLLSKDINLLMTLFVFCCNMIENNKIEKIAGSLLTQISYLLNDNERESFVRDFPLEKKEKISKYFLIMTKFSKFSFQGFSTMDKTKRLHLIKTCIKLLQTEKDVKVELSASELLEFFLEEDIDWITVKSLLFAISEIVSKCHFANEVLERLFSVICFFANRRQRQITSVDGLSGLIGAICFKVANILPGKSIFESIYDGMISYCIAVTPECFYAKLWTAFLLQFETITKSDKNDITSCLNFANDKINNVTNSESLLYQLLTALFRTCSKFIESESEKEFSEMNEEEEIFSPLIATSRHISPRKQAKRSSLPTPHKSKIPQPSNFKPKNSLKLELFDQISVEPSSEVIKTNIPQKKKTKKLPTPKKKQPKPKVVSDSDEDNYLPLKTPLKSSPESVQSLIDQLEQRTPEKKSKSQSPPIILSSVQRISPRNNPIEISDSDDGLVQNSLHTTIEIPQNAFADIFNNVVPQSPPQKRQVSSTPSTPFLSDTKKVTKTEIPLPVINDNNDESLIELADEENSVELPFPRIEAERQEETPEFFDVSSNNTKSGLSDVVFAISGVLKKWNEDSNFN